MTADEVRQALVMRGTPGTVEAYDALLKERDRYKDALQDILDHEYEVDWDGFANVARAALAPPTPRTKGGPSDE